jgi:hypothetical protein
VKPFSALPAAPLAFALGLALGSPALAQSNFLTAPKIGCTPDTVTRCSAADKCETRPASDKDKNEVLVLDFSAKKASIRAPDKTQEFGEIAGDQVADGERRFSIRPAGATDDSRAVKIMLKGDGKLTLFLGGNLNRADATCKLEA